MLCNILSDLWKANLAADVYTFCSYIFSSQMCIFFGQNVIIIVYTLNLKATSWTKTITLSRCKTRQRDTGVTLSEQKDLVVCSYFKKMNISENIQSTKAIESSFMIQLFFCRQANVFRHETFAFDVPYHVDESGCFVYAATRHCWIQAWKPKMKIWNNYCTKNRHSVSSILTICQLSLMSLPPPSLRREAFKL